MSKRDPKKSENIEIRISHDMKQSLQKKATLEGRTVSDVVRHLIEGYLASDAAVSQSGGSPFSAYIRSFFRRHRPAKIGLAGAAAAGLVLIPVAQADDILLSIEGQLVHTEDTTPQTISTKTFSMDASVENGSTLDLDLGTDVMEVRPRDLFLRVTANETVLNDGSEGVVLRMILGERLEGGEEILAKPTVSVKNGSTAEIQVGVEGYEEYSIKVTPRDILPPI